MVAIYVRRIKEGIMTLEEVPIRWKNEVETILKSEGL